MITSRLYLLAFPGHGTKIYRNWMDAWIIGWMDGCIFGWMDGWMDGRMDE